MEIKKECNNCSCIFSLTDKDIKIGDDTYSKTKIVSKTPRIKKTFPLKREYSGIVKRSRTYYEYQYRYITCPVCSYNMRLGDKFNINEICSTIETDTETEHEMFGPNSPCIIGEFEAISYWMSKL